MKRREFIVCLGGAAAAWPVAARAQQSRLPVIGFLFSGSLSGYRHLVVAFGAGLAKEGLVEGKNVAIEYRWAQGQFDLLPALALDLIRHGVAIIVTGGIGSALGVRAASPTIPLVFLAGDDPVRFGLVASLNRPGGSATGIAWLTSQLFAKRLELMRELTPAAATIGVLVNPNSPEIKPQLSEIEDAARSVSQNIRIVNATAEPEFETAFQNLADENTGGVIITNDAFFNSMGEQIVALAAQHRMPAIYDRREYIARGGLISYGTSYQAAYQELGVYAGKVIKGTKPADLPVEQATKFELVVNLKTAKALGLEVPPILLARADEVIE